MQADSIFALVDTLGVAVGAISGALFARRHESYNYDVVGAFGLAIVTALGGGLVRDILMQHGPPLALVNIRYLYIALLGALLGLIFGRNIGKRMEQFILIIDAAALSLFAVAGVTRAINAGLSWLPALFMGIITAVGGSSVRDVLSGRTPMIFEKGQFYAIVAMLAASCFLLLNLTGLPRSLATELSVTLGFLLRLLTLKFGWRTTALREV